MKNRITSLIHLGYLKIVEFISRFSIGTINHGTSIFKVFRYKGVAWYAISLDMNKIEFNWHNQAHIGIVFFLTIVAYALFGWWWFGYSLMFIWEIGDGFKPLWWLYKANPNYGTIRNFIIEEGLYSDGFSLQDPLIHNMAGFVGGMIVIALWVNLVQPCL